MRRKEKQPGSPGLDMELEPNRELSGLIDAFFNIEEIQGFSKKNGDFDGDAETPAVPTPDAMSSNNTREPLVGTGPLSLLVR